MRSDGLDPETLAKIAAQLNPQLACDDPAKAIELARKLLIAADPELAKQEAERERQEAERAEDMRFRTKAQRWDELFPSDELIPVAEAFKALPPGHYKTERKFAAALRKEKLTTPDHKFTTIRAVNELFRQQRKAKQERERERKKAASKKKSQKNVAEFQGRKAERNPPKSGTKALKAEATKQKAEVLEST